MLASGSASRQPLHVLVSREDLSACRPLVSGTGALQPLSLRRQAAGDSGLSSAALHMGCMCCSDAKCHWDGIHAHEPGTGYATGRMPLVLS